MHDATPHHAYSAVPQEVATSFRPPLATPWKRCSSSTSSTTPFFPVRRAARFPVSRGRDPASSPGRGYVHGLRARGTRHAQQDERQDERPDTGGVRHGNVPIPLVFLMTHMVLLVICC